MIKNPTRLGRLPLLGLIVILAVLAVLASGARGADTARTLEDLSTAVAMQMPEFGGMYVDEENDTLYVYWRDGGSETAAPPTMAELRDILGDIDLPHDMVVLPARFGFLQLKQWHDSMARHVLWLPGVVLIGIDEAKNRLLIGVEDSEAWDLIGRVDQQLIELDIPFEAVNLEEVGPIELGSSLNDRHRPVVGGLQIFAEADPPLARPFCTLGFNAILRGILGFVTNSHCSARQGRADLTVYYQPTPTFDNQIGIEILDPRTGRSLPDVSDFVLLRRSDSNFSRLTGGEVPLFPLLDSRLGFIARPALAPSGPAPPIAPPTAWDGVSTFRIIAERGRLAAGMSVTKVGITTGRTEGTVVMRISLVTTPGVVLLNQLFATYLSDFGDSGAPVVMARAPDPPGESIDTSLAGINFGFTRFRGRRVSVFSPIEGVQADLGSLNTCAPPLSC